MQASGMAPSRYYEVDFPAVRNSTLFIFSVALSHKMSSSWFSPSVLFPPGILSVLLRSGLRLPSFSPAAAGHQAKGLHNHVHACNAKPYRRRRTGRRGCLFPRASTSFSFSSSRCAADLLLPLPAIPPFSPPSNTSQHIVHTIGEVVLHRQPSILSHRPT